MLFPKRVLKIVECCDTDSTRFALGAVKVERALDGRPVVIATDGRTLVATTWDECDICPTFEKIGESEKIADFSAMIPKDALKTVDRGIKNRKMWKDAWKCAFLDETSANGSVKVATTDGENSQVSDLRLMDGRFPKWHDVLPKYESQKVARVVIDPQLLIQVLKVIDSATRTEKSRGVEMIVPLDDCSAITISGSCKELGIQSVGVLMPMARDDRKQESGALPKFPAPYNSRDARSIADKLLAELADEHLDLLQRLAENQEREIESLAHSHNLQNEDQYHSKHGKELHNVQSKELADQAERHENQLAEQAERFELENKDASALRELHEYKQALEDQAKELAEKTELAELGELATVAS